MGSPILKSGFARVALRTLGMAPLDREIHLTGSLDGLERLLFVDSGQLSDILFFLPVVAEIKRDWPDIQLHMMAEERWADLLRKEARLDGLILYRSDQLRARSSSYLRLLREVKGRSFDGVFLMGEESDPPRDLVAYASQASLRVGAYQPEREALLNCMLRWRGQGRYKMELAEEMTRFVGLKYDAGAWRFRLRPEELRAADQMIHFRKPVKEQLLIGVDPSPGKSSRRFASSNLHFLVDHLVDKLRAKVMLFHVGEDSSESEEFRRRIRQSETLDMPSQGLRETLALLSRCDLFVAGNTELFHVAVAGGVPAIGLFTEADGVRWEPRGREHVAVVRGKPGESLPITELDKAVERIRHATHA